MVLAQENGDTPFPFLVWSAGQWEFVRKILRSGMEGPAAVFHFRTFRPARVNLYVIRLSSFRPREGKRNEMKWSRSRRALVRAEYAAGTAALVAAYPTFVY